MANGDLARALAYQSNLQSDTRALFRQWMNNVTQSNERDKQRLYEKTVREEDRKIAAGIREEDRRQSLSEWNRNETRYQDSVRRQSDSDSRNQDIGLVNQGSEISNLQAQKDYYKQLLVSGGFKSIHGIDLAESRVNFLTGRIADATKNAETLNDIGMPEYYVNQASNFYMQGNDAAAFNIVDNHFKNKFKDPQTLAEAQLLITNIKADKTSLGKLAGAVGEGVADERKRLEKSIANDIGRFREIYELETPFDPDALRRSFKANAQTRLKNAGFDLSDEEVLQRLLGETGKYSEAIKSWEDKYILDEDASTHSAKQANADGVKIINNIIAEEKVRPPEKGEGFPDLIPGVGTLGGLYVGFKVTEKPRKFLAEKAGQAGRYVKWVAKELPNEDIGKFLETVSKKTPGQVGTMMPKVEKLISEIDQVTLEGENWRGPKGERGYKKQVARLNAKLDKQVEKIKKTLRKSKGVSSKLTDANLEKLIRNPNKWFLPKVKTKMLSLTASTGKMARAWGGFRIAQEVGKALGDETGGVVTGLGAAGTWKLAKKIYKKKGPQWMAKRLTPIIGKALTTRVMQGAASGSILPVWGNLMGTVLGAGFAAKDVGEALGIIGQEIESE